MFLDKFNNYYAPRLVSPAGSNPVRDRASTLRHVFRELNDKTNVVFVETGTTRGDHGSLAFGDDGCATIIFDDYVSQNGGVVYTVDIEMKNCEHCKSLVSDNVKVYNDDSVNFLWNYTGPPIDVFYMDSYDFVKENQHPSKFHHIKELLAATKHLKDGSIIIIDDHDALLDGSGDGKGSYVKDFMENIGMEKLFEGYQIGWKWKK